MQKGLTLTELVVLLFIIIAVSLFLLPIRLFSNMEKSKQTRCKSNLEQFGKCFMLYRGDYGGNIKYPDAGGKYLVGRLYKVKILTDNEVYICPSTPDENEGVDLGAASGLTGQNISYAGRKNKIASKYPGIYKMKLEEYMTTLASDDFEETPNHENGQVIQFLFLAGHVLKKRIISVEDDDYKAFASEKGDKLADPLTN